MFRIGFGYDVHALVEARKLILGGVEITHSKGLKGHSDADVLIHALMDALLGALGLGDIGQHFPDTDPAYKDISSLSMLENRNGSDGAGRVCLEQPGLHPGGPGTQNRTFFA